MATKKINQVSQDDIDAAQDALGQGNAELLRLKESFLNGDGGEWSAVKSQEGVVEFAAAEIERLARAKARHEESLRQGELGIIRAEMDTYAAAEGEHFVDLLKGVETAVLAFAAAYVQHNQTISRWRERMTANGVQPQGNRLAPPKTDQGLSLAPSGAVRAGGREFTQEFSGQPVQELLMALRGHDGISKNYFESDYVCYPKLDELYARVSSPVQESAGIPDDALFYRHTNGAIHMRGAESPIPVEDLKRLELRLIDRAEAVAE